MLLKFRFPVLTLTNKVRALTSFDSEGTHQAASHHRQQLKLFPEISGIFYAIHTNLRQETILIVI